ncbi:hypothetical protein, partial [Streptomyces sp. BE230]|uniref:hypothetical protein n=1 Tax=Streptomyces sp. BE230 TaxID=3002526 RepID=UPI002ED30808|nr:hypothetical protein [Streptomyces sp. BE230]
MLTPSGGDDACCGVPSSLAASADDCGGDQGDRPRLLGVVEGARPRDQEAVSPRLVGPARRRV